MPSETLQETTTTTTIISKQKTATFNAGTTIAFTVNGNQQIDFTVPQGKTLTLQVILNGVLN